MVRTSGNDSDGRPDGGDAMAYRNRLDRQRADGKLTVAEGEREVKIADELVDQAKASKAKKMDSSQIP